MIQSIFSFALVALVFSTGAQAHTAKYVLNCSTTDQSLTAMVLSTPAGDMITFEKDWTSSVGTLDTGAYELKRQCKGVKCPFISDVSGKMDRATMSVLSNDAELGWASAITVSITSDSEKVEAKMNCKHDSVREKLLRAYWTSFKEAHTVTAGETVRPEDMARVSLDLEKLYQAHAAMTAEEVQDPKKEKVTLHANRPFAVEKVVGSFDEQGNFVVDENVGKTESPRLAVGCMYVSTQEGKVPEMTFRCMFPRFVVNDIKPCKYRPYSVRLPLFRLSTGSWDRVGACPWIRGPKAPPVGGSKVPTFTRTRNTNPKPSK